MLISARSANATPLLRHYWQRFPKLLLTVRNHEYVSWLVLVVDLLRTMHGCSAVVIHYFAIIPDNSSLSFWLVLVSTVVLEVDRRLFADRDLWLVVWLLTVVVWLSCNRAWRFMAKLVLKRRSHDGHANERGSIWIDWMCLRCADLDFSAAPQSSQRNDRAELWVVMCSVRWLYNNCLTYYKKIDLFINLIIYTDKTQHTGCCMLLFVGKQIMNNQ